MDRMTCNIFLLLSVVYFTPADLSGSRFCNGDTIEHSSDPKPPKHNCGTQDNIPAYILVLLGFVSILLLLVSILLIYVLVKTQFLRTLNIWNKNTNTQTPEKLEDGGTQSQVHADRRQECQKKTAGSATLDKTTNESKNENENYQTLKQQDSEVTIASEYNTLRNPKKTEASGNISPRIIKGATKDMPIILPEQMSLICKEVLKRGAKNNSTNSLQNIDQLVMEAKPAEETNSSKCASTSALDIYDTLQTPSCDEKSRTQKDDAVNKKSKTLSISSVDDVTETDCDIYDCPKAQDGIYDLPKESTAKVENQSGYITPYFSANPSLSGIFKAKEEKLAYAQVNALSDQECSIKNESKDTEKKDNEANETIDSKECEYEFPRKRSKDSKDQMYINANDVPKDDIKKN